MKLLTAVLPASIVLLAMYLAVKSFISKEINKEKLQILGKNKEQALPIRLQAYERIVLFLERISPQNIVLRVNDPSFSAADLRQRILFEMREEFNHNLSQQVYMSQGVWSQVKVALEEVGAVVNQAGEEVPSDAKGFQLAKVIFDKMSRLEEDPIQRALHVVKTEVHQLF